MDTLPVQLDTSSGTAQIPSVNAAVFDLSATSVTAALSLAGSTLSFSLSEAGLAPPSLITFRELSDSVEFPSLLDRIGEDTLVFADGRPPQRPHVYLRQILEAITVPFQEAWGMPESFGFVVSGFATEMQRSLLVREARSAGWPDAILVNKTTALAAQALQQRQSGDFLMLVLGYSAAEASVVRIESRQLRALSYSSEARLAGSRFDASIIRYLAEEANPTGGGNGLSLSLYGRWEWMTLRNALDQVRKRLDSYPTVRIEMPDSWTGGKAVSVVLLRERWEQRLANDIRLLEPLLERCCREAGVAQETLAGIIACGRPLFQSSLRKQLIRAAGDTHLSLLPSESPVLGACLLLTQGPQRSTLEKRLPRSGGEFVLRLPESERPPSASVAHPKAQSEGESLSSIIERFRRQASAGNAAQVRAELSILKKYLNAVDLSLQNPFDAMKLLAVETPALSPAEPSPTADHEEQTQLAAKSLQFAAKAERRKYAMALEDIKKAENALSLGQLERAVAFGHMAYKASQDGRIFRAMIEVHLRAATRRAPTVPNFEDERRWLLCAHQDDPTNQRVQDALSGRVMSHVEQLLAFDDSSARSQAITCLYDFSRLLPLSPDQEEVFRRLKAGDPEPKAAARSAQE